MYPQLLIGVFASEPAHTQVKDILDGGKKVAGQYDQYRQVQAVRLPIEDKRAENDIPAVLQQIVND